MRSLMTALATALMFLGVLTSCRSEPEQLNPTPNSVTYQYDGDDLKAATARAMQYCNSGGRSATLRNVSQTEGKNVAIFDCQ